MSVTYVRNPSTGEFEKVGPGGASTDTTLSQAGKPADAAAVGAALTNYATSASVSAALNNKSDEDHSHTLSELGITLADLGFQYGKVNVSCTANTASKAAVTFDKTYKTMPIVTVTAGSSSPGTVVQEVSISDVTYTGFNVNVYRTNTSTTTVQWMAAGQV